MAQGRKDEPEDTSADAPAVSEDAKARFREALDRKKARSHKSAAAGEQSDRPGGVQGSETSGPMQREFRRKSG